VTYITSGNIVYVLPFTSKSMFWMILRHIVAILEQFFWKCLGKESSLHWGSL